MSTSAKNRSRALERVALAGGTALLVASISYKVLTRFSARFRAFTFDAMVNQSTLDRAILVFDFLSQIKGLGGSSRPGAGKDFSGLDISSVAFDERNRLLKSDFQGATLSNVRFTGCRLYRSNWTDATLTNVVFEDCGLEKAQLLGARFAGTVAFISCTFNSEAQGVAALLDEFGATRFPRVMDHVEFRECRISGVNLNKRTLREAQFVDCAMDGVELSGSNISGGSFVRCSLTGARMANATLAQARIETCDLSNCDLRDAVIGGAHFERCEIYGVSLWGTQGEVAAARALTLTSGGTRRIELDGLHVAIVVESLLQGGGVREIVDGLTSTMVLLMGRFSPAHKPVLDAIRDYLRTAGYTAVIFDTAPPDTADTTETIGVIARLSRFVIADVTEPKSAPFELAQFISGVRTPVQVLSRGEAAFSMFSDMLKYPWVMTPLEYPDATALIAALPDIVDELEIRRAEVYP